MANNGTKLVAWGEGDRTVGDGTVHAEMQVDAVDPEMVSFLKEEVAKVLSQVWDLAPRFVHVMTREEFEAYTKAEVEVD